MQQHAVAHITSAGTIQLVAAPGVGQRIRVVGLHLSAGIAGTVTIGFSATNQRVWNIGANQSADVLTGWAGDANAALSLTSPATGPTDVTIDFEIESAP